MKCPWMQTLDRDRDVCVVFPGQGTQKKGMADKLMLIPECKALFDQVRHLVDLLLISPPHIPSSPPPLLCPLSSLLLTRFFLLLLLLSGLRDPRVRLGSPHQGGTTGDSFSFPRPLPPLTLSSHSLLSALTSPLPFPLSLSPLLTLPSSL